MTKQIFQRERERERETVQHAQSAFIEQYVGDDEDGETEIEDQIIEIERQRRRRRQQVVGCSHHNGTEWGKTCDGWEDMLIGSYK